MFKKDDLNTEAEKDYWYVYGNGELILWREIKLDVLLNLDKQRLGGDRMILPGVSVKDKECYLTEKVFVA